MHERFSAEKDIRVRHRQDAVQDYMSPGVQQVSPHFHYQCELLVGISGEADFVIAGSTYHVGTGSILFVSNMENHYISTHSGNFDRYTIRFSNEALAALIPDSLLLSIFKQRPAGFCHHYFCTPQELAIYQRVLEVMMREYEEQRPFWDYIVASRLRDLLVWMYRRNPAAFPGERNTKGQNTIFHIQNYIEAHPEENLSLDEMAARFYISKYHLSHSFKSVTGFNFKQYIVTARISKAKDLLLNTDLEVNVIGQQVGFGNTSHFIRSFRTAEGMSPLQYRNRARREL